MATGASTLMVLSSQPTEQSVMNARKFVSFKLNHQNYALPLESIVRIVRAVALTIIPDSPRRILGMINMAGQAISVINLRFLFSLKDKKIDINDRLMILNVNQNQIAILVDEVMDVLEPYPHQMGTSNKLLEQSRFLTTTIQQGEKLILVIDPTQVLIP
jgi:purine-binding chemotaxis protein CheW